MLPNRLETLLFLLFLALFVRSATVEYNDEGVLRKDGSCDITFVNFGIEKTIINQSVKKTLVDNTNNLYNITLLGLINANSGLNMDTEFQPEELYNYIEVTQYNETVTTKDIPFVNSKNLKFDLVLYNMKSCDGLVIKQTFKEKTLNVANFVYYVNQIPESINQEFDANLFGPSANYPFEKIHWNMNEGLEDLMKTCGIYISYNKYVGSNTPHWSFYLSTENINAKNCDKVQFAQVLARNYIDYSYTIELLGENYMGYVLKREGSPEAHMDGVISDNHYIVEIYQNSCNNQFSSQTSCTIRSDDPLSFEDFAVQMIQDCLSDTIEFDADPQWTIKNGKATGYLNNQILTITNSDKGSLPDKVKDLINYKSFKSGVVNIKDITPVARFVLSFDCKDGSFINEKCQCQACSPHCVKCTNALTCEECVDEDPIIKDEYSVCIVKQGYYEDEETHVAIECNKECASCNSSESCTSCKDPKAIISDGVCICPDSYMTEEGNCFVCDKSCSKCDINGCTACADPTKQPDENGNC